MPFTQGSAKRAMSCSLLEDHDNEETNAQVGRTVRPADAAGSIMRVVFANFFAQRVKCNVIKSFPIITGGSTASCIAAISI
jgi:hypothetical protein